MALSLKDLRTAWGRLKDAPFGKRLFSSFFGASIPYTGSVKPRVLELSPGHARIAIDERRAVRNHLKSIHAIALANLAEMTTGLALGFGLPDGMRTILTRLEVDYLKKARGRITATADAPPVRGVETRDVVVDSVLTDEAGDVVARGRGVWRVGEGAR